MATNSLKLPPLFWLGIKRVRQLVALTWWSFVYHIWLRSHPACRAIGRLQVSGRMKLDLDPYGQLYVGDDVRINSGSLINAIGGHRRVIIALHRGAQLHVGPRTGLSSCTIVCKSTITIGADVLIGGGTVIVDSDLHALTPAERESSRIDNVLSAPITIGDRVFVGTDALILKGVSIGPDAIIGAGAVITRDVPAGEIGGGNPARCIGQTPVPFVVVSADQP